MQRLLFGRHWAHSLCRGGRSSYSERLRAAADWRGVIPTNGQALIQETLAEVRSSGFAFIPKYALELSLLEIANRLGQIFAPSGCQQHAVLTPRQGGPPNTYSGNFGLGQFPLHTDLAHWALPPRYLVLRCVKGHVDVPTLLEDVALIVANFGANRLRRTLVKPRRPIRGGRALLPLLSRTNGDDLFRWDEVFVVPATERSGRICDAVRAHLASVQPARVILADAGDTLIIDNWKVLHGRAAAHDAAETRLLERVYLSELR
jgi:L-asparagine oxygenase